MKRTEAEATRSVEGALANDSTILVDASETGDVIISKCNDSAAMRARAMKQSIRHLLDSE
jgi:vacuolar-type H+-ATPase subunit H